MAYTLGTDKCIEGFSIDMSVMQDLLPINHFDSTRYDDKDTYRLRKMRKKKTTTKYKLQTVNTLFFSFVLVLLIQFG